MRYISLLKKLVVALLILTLSGTVMAQRGKGQRQGQRSGNRSSQGMAILDLSDSQQTKMRTLRKDYMAEMKELRKEKQAVKVKDDKARITQKMDKAKNKYEKKVSGVLSAEQYKKWKANKNKGTSGNSKGQRSGGGKNGSGKSFSQGSAQGTSGAGAHREQRGGSQGGGRR